MEENIHYEKAVTNEPAMARGPDLLMREILNRTTEATLALAAEQRLANLISLLSHDAFTNDKAVLETEIRKTLKLGKEYETETAVDGEDSADAYLKKIDEEQSVNESEYGVVDIKQPFL